MKRTTTEAELRQWVADGKTTKEIGEILGVPKFSVAKVKSVLGIYSGRHGRKAAPIDFELVERLIQAGQKINSIEKDLGFKPSGLRSRLKQAGRPTSIAEYWKREALKGKE